MQGMETLFMDTIDQFLKYLVQQRCFTEKSVYNHGLYLRRTERELKRSLLKVERGSEIEAAIWEAAKKRKMKWNGGNMEDGGMGWRFRCAGKIVNYLQWAFREQLIPRNPYPENTFKAPYKPKADWLSEERLDYLFTCDRLSERDKMMVHYFYDTGFRVSEAVNAKLEDIIPEEMRTPAGKTWQEWYTSAYSVKEHRIKKQPLTETTVWWIQMIVGYRKFRSPWLFCDPETGKKSSDKALRLRFRQISAIVGFRVHPHKMRHTVGTHMTKYLGIEKASEHLGHQTLDMTKHYYHQSGGERHENLHNLAKKIAEKKNILIGA